MTLPYPTLPYSITINGHKFTVSHPASFETTLSVNGKKLEHYEDVTPAESDLTFNTICDTLSAVAKVVK